MWPDDFVGNPDRKDEVQLPPPDVPAPEWSPPSASLPGPYAGYTLICSVRQGPRASVWMAEGPEESLALSLALTFYTHEKALQQPAVADAFLKHGEQLRRVEGPFLVRLRQVLDLRPFRDAGWPPMATVTQLVEPSLQRVLADLIVQEERMPAALVLSWARHLFEAVETLHGGYGWVHGNIKPSNILLHLLRGRPYRRVGSLDGATALLGDLITACPIGDRVPAWVPTNDEWKAPEVRGTPPDGRLARPTEDLYALGLVLRRLIDSAEGDLTSLQRAADSLADSDPGQRLTGRSDLRTLLFPVPATLDHTDEPALILRRSQAFRRRLPGQPNVQEPRQRREPSWAEVDGVPGYAIRGEIGRGGMGIVYEARELALNRLVAIKVLPTGQIASRAERFRIEASALARLNHPNIIQVYGGRESDRPYLVMELLEGRSLRKIVQDDGPLPATEAARIAEAIARALDYVHLRAILHRDIKPSNVLITPGGTPKLIDFGLAKLQDDDPEITPPGTLMGTPHYLAPELLKGSDRAEARTDLYGVGATLYYMLTGHPPLEANGQYELLCEIEKTRPMAPRERNATVPAGLEAICLRCLEKEPARRYSTAGVLADALLAFREGGGETTNPLPRPEDPIGTREGPAKKGPGGLRPDVVWPAVAGKPTPGGIDRDWAGSILASIFPAADSVVVVAQLLGYRPQPDAFVCLVEVSGLDREDCLVVKVANVEGMQKELDAWGHCVPHRLRRDIVLLPPKLYHDPQGQPRALVYPTVQQFIGVDRVATLEEAFLGCVRNGIPTTASLGILLAELFTRIDHLLYRHSVLVQPRYPLVLNHGQEAFGYLSPWVEGQAREARQVANTALPIGSDEDFHDPVDVLNFLRFAASDGRPADAFPALVRGPAHGDLHGRNILVGLVDSEARWPVVFDFARIAKDNLVGWDFAKLETELKIRAYPRVFAQRNELDYVREVKEFERNLATATERCHNEGNWPQAVGSEYGSSPVERVHTVLLGLRRQVAVCLGWRRGRPKHWLEEYYFLLSWYGVSTGRYENMSSREQLGAFVSAGVALARYLDGRLSRLTATAPTPDRDPVQEVLAGKYPDFREPLRLARKWARESGTEWKARALQVLRKLKTLYPDALQVRHELALVLRELGREDESQDELHDAGRDFKTLDEDLLSFWARSFKERGDKALAGERIEQALKLYVQAEEMYLRTYELRHDRFPGVNAATHRFLAASLAHQLGRLEQSRELVNSSRELARALLADKENWVQRLSDDNVWVRATEAEVYLLLGQWAEAEKLYQEARAQPTHQPFHSKSMGTQATRLVQAYRRLGQSPQGALSDVEQFFGPRS